MKRIGLGSFVLLAMVSAAHAQAALFREDFENGYANWTMTGLWNPEASTDACGGISSGHQGTVFPSGTHCAWYGQDSTCNFDTGFANSGELTSLVPVTLPPTGRVSLRFWNSRFAECSLSPHVDITQVQAALGWQPRVQLEEGLKRTIAYFDELLGQVPTLRPSPSVPLAAQEARPLPPVAAVRRKTARPRRRVDAA